jgi:hypothetical protein
VAHVSILVPNDYQGRGVGGSDTPAKATTELLTVGGGMDGIHFGTSCWFGGCSGVSW